MTLHRMGRALVPAPAALARLAAGLLCAGALLQGAPAHAQNYKTLPESGKAITLQEPTPDQLFRVESEAALRQRMIAEARQKKAQPPLFMEDPVLAGAFMGRAWSPMVAIAEPSYVCYRRLLFEQINAERYGWDLGAIAPLVSLGVFYFDVATLPYHLATRPCCPCECSAGYCLPGSCVPLLLYPPECSATGTLAEAAAIGLLLVAFP